MVFSDLNCLELEIIKNVIQPQPRKYFIRNQCVQNTLSLKTAKKVKRSSQRLPWLVSCCFSKHYEQKPLGEEWAYFMLQFIIHHDRKPRQELRAGPWRQTLKQSPLESVLTALFLTAYSVFLHTPGLPV